MSLIQTTAPLVEPITLADGKLWCKQDQTADDTVIAALISAAREKAEQHTQRQLAPATYLLTVPHLAPYDAGFYEGLGEGSLILPKPPLIKVNSIQVYQNNALVTLDTSTYQVIGSEPAYVRFTTLPTHDVRPDAIQVSFSCGYGAAVTGISGYSGVSGYSGTSGTTSAGVVPAGILLAMRWLIAAAYMVREDEAEIQVSKAEKLLNIYRVWRVGNEY